MIAIRFEEREKIGLQYALETLHGCSPFGIEKIRRLRFYAPEERAELETELYNVEQAAIYGEELKAVYDKICMLLCQMKEIRAELKATGDDGIQVIARHMNYGLYRVEGKADCPRDALNICRMLSLKPEILAQIEQSY